jgi:hypothetical protein
MPPSGAGANQDNKQQKRTLTLVFDKASQKYRYQPERIELNWQRSRAGRR